MKNTLLKWQRWRRRSLLWILNLQNKEHTINRLNYVIKYLILLSLLNFVCIFHILNVKSFLIRFVVTATSKAGTFKFNSLSSSNWSNIILLIIKWNEQRSLQFTTRYALFKRGLIIDSRLYPQKYCFLRSKKIHCFPFTFFFSVSVTQCPTFPTVCVGEYRSESALLAYRIGPLTPFTIRSFISWELIPSLITPASG